MRKGRRSGSTGWGGQKENHRIDRGVVRNLKRFRMIERKYTHATSVLDAPLGEGVNTSSLRSSSQQR